MAQYSEEFNRTLNESAHLLRQNRPGEAVAKLRDLYRQAPEHPDVAINLGGAYILQNKWNRAVEVLRKAVRHNPDNVMLWSNLGAAELGHLELSGPKQQEKAIAAYQAALQIDPEAPNVHYHLGLIYKERKEYVRAGAFFQRALEVNAADRDARLWLERISKLLKEEVARRGDDETASTGEDRNKDRGTGNTDINGEDRDA
jgi:cytochrome c-type biogenesis protein CcmH/NrfG